MIPIIKLIIFITYKIILIKNNNYVYMNFKNNLTISFIIFQR